MPETITYAEYKTIESQVEEASDGCFAFAQGRYIEVLRCSSKKSYNVMVTIFSAPDVTGPDVVYKPTMSTFVTGFIYTYVGDCNAPNSLSAELHIEGLAKQKFLDVIANHT